MTDRLRIDIDGGKYTLVQHENGGTEMLRYGEPWMGQEGGGFAGVNAVLAMGYELEELRPLKEQLARANAMLEDVKQRCLVADDDGITVTEDPHLPTELFERLCSHLNEIEAIPDPGPMITLKFRPEAWVNDYAMSVDPEAPAPDTWQVPKSTILEEFPTEEDWNNEAYKRDAMRFEGNAPKWIRDWTGPFEVEIDAGEDLWEAVVHSPVGRPACG